MNGGANEKNLLFRPNNLIRMWKTNIKSPSTALVFLRPFYYSPSTERLYEWDTIVRMKNISHQSSLSTTKITLSTTKTLVRPNTLPLSTEFSRSTPVISKTVILWKSVIFDHVYQKLMEFDDLNQVLNRMKFETTLIKWIIQFKLEIKVKSIKNTSFQFVHLKQKIF